MAGIDYSNEAWREKLGAVAKEPLIMRKVFALVAVITLFMSAASCRGPSNNPPVAISDPSFVGGYDLVPASHIADLVKGAGDRGVTVGFSWTRGDKRFVLGPGIFVWRESSQARRWDLAHQGPDDPLSGSIFFTAANGKSTQCSWVRQPRASTVGMQCDRPEFAYDPGPAAAFASAANGSASHRYDDVSIAGRDAACYAISVGAFAGTLCLDSAEQVPVYLSFPHPSTGQLQTLEAMYVRTGAPTGLERVPDAVAGDELPLQALDLPVEFVFDCGDPC